MRTNLDAAFPDFRIFNRGFGDSTMQDLIHYFDRLIAVLPTSTGSRLVYEGDNDLAHGRTVKEITSDYKKFTERMKTQLPFSDFAFISVKPNPSRIDLLPLMIDLNASMQAAIFTISSHQCLILMDAHLHSFTIQTCFILMRLVTCYGN